jgi:anti-repressor protein
MMTDLMNLDFRGSAVRVVMIEGEPWWVVNDVCAVLGIIAPRKAAERIDEDDVRQAHVTDAQGRDQATNVLNESGLYELIFRSEKPAAKDFRRWVTRDVLPQIRKTGGYVEREMSPDLQRIYDLVMVQARQEADILRTQR